MASPLVSLAHDVEKEEVDVVVQRLVVQEQLGQVTQVLAVLLLLAPVNLKHANPVVPINLIPGRMEQLVLAQVALQLLLALEKLQQQQR